MRSPKVHGMDTLYGRFHIFNEGVPIPSEDIIEFQKLVVPITQDELDALAGEAKRGGGVGGAGGAGELEEEVCLKLGSPGSIHLNRPSNEVGKFFCRFQLGEGGISRSLHRSLGSITEVDRTDWRSFFGENQLVLSTLSVWLYSGHRSVVGDG